MKPKRLKNAERTDRWRKECMDRRMDRPKKPGIDSRFLEEKNRREIMQGNGQKKKQNVFSRKCEKMDTVRNFCVHASLFLPDSFYVPLPVPLSSSIPLFKNPKSQLESQIIISRSKSQLQLKKSLCALRLKYLP